MLYLNYMFSKYLLIVKPFGSLRERCYIGVYYYYYLVTAIYWYIWFQIVVPIKKKNRAFIKVFPLGSYYKHDYQLLSQENRGSYRGDEWFFKNSGSRKILFEFHGSLSLFFWAVMCVSQSRFFIWRCLGVLIFCNV